MKVSTVFEIKDGTGVAQLYEVQATGQEAAQKIKKETGNKFPKLIGFFIGTTYKKINLKSSR